MYGRKSVGSRMESWGTPALTGYSCEDFPSRTTRSSRLEVPCKKGLVRNKCFPVNFAKFLRTHFFIEHLRWNHSKPSITEKRRNKAKYLTWNSRRLNFVKTSMPNPVKSWISREAFNLIKSRRSSSKSNYESAWGKMGWLVSWKVNWSIL